VRVCEGGEGGVRVSLGVSVGSSSRNLYSHSQSARFLSYFWDSDISMNSYRIFGILKIEFVLLGFKVRKNGLLLLAY
jgi:hypothetical protein